MSHNTPPEQATFAARYILIDPGGLILGYSDPLTSTATLEEGETHAQARYRFAQWLGDVGARSTYHIHLPEALSTVLTIANTKVLGEDLYVGNPVYHLSEWEGEWMWFFDDAEEVGVQMHLLDQLLIRKEGTKGNNHANSFDVLPNPDFRARHRTLHTEQHNSDYRSETGIFTNRRCTLNVVESLRDDFVRQKELLGEPDPREPDHELEARLARIKTSIHNLDRDRDALLANEELHMPHYADTVLADALVEGHGVGVIVDSLAVYREFAAKLRVHLMQESLPRGVDRADLLQNMETNIRADYNRSAFDRIVLKKVSEADPKRVFDVAKLTPPQTGSAPQ